MLLRMLKFSAFMHKHTAITPVFSLYRVFAGAISLQFPYSCRSTVWDSFYALGIVPVTHIKMKSLWMTWCTPSGKCLSNSLGMPSWPAAFTCLRCLIFSWNVARSEMFSSMLLNPGLPEAVSSVRGSTLLYAPCFKNYFLFSFIGLKDAVFADPEAGFACSWRLLCTYPSTASGSLWSGSAILRGLHAWAPCLEGGRTRSRQACDSSLSWDQSSWQDDFVGDGQIPRHFTKLSRSVCLWERLYEILSIKESMYLFNINITDIANERIALLYWILR